MYNHVSHQFIVIFSTDDVFCETDKRIVKIFLSGGNSHMNILNGDILRPFGFALCLSL